MASNEDILKLAALSRLSITDEELPAVARDIDAILAYMSKLDELTLSESGVVVPVVHNVMREDGEPYPAKEFTEAIAKQFPSRDGDALSVKQIISHD